MKLGRGISLDQVRMASRADRFSKLSKYISAQTA